MGAIRRRTAPTRRRELNLDVLTRHIGYFVRRLQVAVFQDFIRSLEPADLRPGQYSVLVLIGANPALRQADVAAELGIERARLVRVLDELARRGLIERSASATDRRAHALHLTASGEALLARAKRLAAQHEARIARRIGARRHKALLLLLREAARRD